jgi:hypothetical protein
MMVGDMKAPTLFPIGLGLKVKSSDVNQTAS